MPTEATTTYTVQAYLQGIVNFPVDDTAIYAICKARGVEMTQSYADALAAEVPIRLLYADLLKWIVLGPSRVTDTRDSDNGWAHSGGGHTLSQDDKKLLLSEANAIYAELEPTSVVKVRRIRVHSFGVSSALLDTDGTPLPRIHPAQ